MIYHIASLSISGFKGFQSQTKITLKNLTVLAGANSVGKSTTIQSIMLSRTAHELARNTSVKTIRVPLNGPYMLALGNTGQVASSKNINFSVEFAGKRTPETLSLAAEVDQTYLTLENSIKRWPKSVFNEPNFHYLNAERIGPRPFHESSIAELPTVGFQGEYAVALLVQGRSFDTAIDKNFHTNHKISFESPNNLTEQTQLWMNFIIPDINISTKNIREINRSTATYNSHSAANVGFGISYVLPIIVAGLIAEKNTLFVIENPEAHLHPFGQSKIGQFLAMVAATGTQVVVETHSEHVINGMRVASMNNWIEPEKILVNFFNRQSGDKTVNINPIEVNKMGDLSDFPLGFFDQSAQDLIEIVKKRREKQ